ncbi:MAG: hypothetical protein K2P78_08760 [Gemmataceae bacterium]|nr:hypothetical protein [Gemmataceae bacterium]
MTPNPPPAPPAESRGGTWKSTIKVVLPLVALVGVVFGVTYLSTYVPKSTDSADPNAKVGDGKEPALSFYSSTRSWNPESADPQDHSFPGFYERGAEGKAQFWFENRNPAPVTLKLVGVSCAACSKGTLYVVPPATTRQALHLTAGLAGGPVLAAGPVAVLDVNRLTPAAAFQFEDPTKVEFTVPAAVENPDGWSPTWGVLELGFTARESKTLYAKFRAEVAGGRSDELQFAIAFEVAEPVRVFPDLVDLGQFPESAPPPPRDFIVYSSTRSQAEFPAPTIVVFPGSGGNAKFVTTGAPVPLTPDQQAFLFAALSERAKKPVRVTAAYRVPVEVTNTAGDARLDIGLLERQIQVTGLGIDPKTITVRGNVRGGVWLANGNAIDLGGFRSSNGGTFTDEVVTDDPKAELVVVEGQQRPEFVKVTLDRQEPFGGKGLFKVRIQVPPGKQVGQITDGVIVLEKKGPTPQRIRIPLKGRGEL